MASPSGSGPAEPSGPAPFDAADAHALVIDVGGGDAALVGGVLADPRYGGYAPERVRLVTGADTTREGVRTTLRALAERVGPASTVVVCCLGPVVVIPERGGTPAFDAIALSTRPGDVLAVPELYRFFATLAARHVLFAYEGAHPDVALAEAGPGRVVIAAHLSDGAREEAARRTAGRQVSFARALAEALSGGAAGEDGVRVRRLFEHVRTALAREQRAAGEPRQSPRLAGDLGRDFVVAAGTAVVTGPTAPRAELPNAHALLVGIDAYPHAPLSECVRGAVAMRDALVAGGYPPANVRLLLDREATRDAILAGLDEVLRRADADATVLGYFAGHGTTVPAAGARGRGAPEPALVPADYERGGVITTADLDERLARARTRRGVIVADCDHSEGIGGDAPGRVWLAATRLDQVGYEVPGGPGRFTGALLAGLQGAAADADGAVRILSLFEYAHQQVVASPDARGVSPTVGGDLTDDFVVARSPGVMPSALTRASDGYRYDAYLSYAAEDEALARDLVLRRLDDAGVRVAVSRDVGGPGAYRVATAERGLAQARRWLVLGTGRHPGGEATPDGVRAPGGAAGADVAGRLVHLLVGEVVGDAQRSLGAQALVWSDVVESREQFSQFLTWLRDPSARLEAQRPDVFISVAWRDREPAQRIADALTAGGLTVWFDRDALALGTGVSAPIRGAIDTCALFIPVISHRAATRATGYFRAEWDQAVRRSKELPRDAAFILPVVVDDTAGADAEVPDEFRMVRWARLPDGHATPEFVSRVAALVRRRAADLAPAEASTDAAMDADEPGPLPPALLTRLSPSALGWAEAYRRETGQPHVGTAHLMAGLYQQGGVWTRALFGLGDPGRRWLELSTLARLMGVEAPPATALPPVEPVPRDVMHAVVLSPDARRAVREAVRLAEAGGGGAVRARHLLAGILTLPDDPAAHWLAGILGVDPAALSRLVNDSLDGMLAAERVAELRRGAAERTLRHESEVYTLAFHPDGTTLAVGCYDGSVHVYDAPSGEVLATLAVPNALVVAGLAWSPDGSVLVANTWQGGARAWPWERGGRGESTSSGWPVGAEPVKYLAFSPDGRWLLAQHAERSDFIVCDATSLPWRASPIGVPGSEAKFEAAFAPDARTVVFLNDASAVPLPVRPHTAPQSPAPA